MICKNKYREYNDIFNIEMSARLTGCVKWFNNKSGFGFITLLDGDSTGKDIFVHYSAIKVANDQFRYLVQGEYVEFELTKSAEGSKHEYQADKISGIKGGQLMCESQNVVKTFHKERVHDINEGFVEVSKRRGGKKTVSK
jgi:CspA family cold shock protein